MAKLNRRSALLASGGNSPLVNPQQTNPNPNLPPQNSAPMKQGPPPVPVRNIGQQPVPSHGSVPQRHPASINFTVPPLQNLNSDPNPATPLPNIPSRVKPQPPPQPQIQPQIQHQIPIQAQLPPPPPEEDDFVPPPPPEEDDFPQQEIVPPLPTRTSLSHVTQYATAHSEQVTTAAPSQRSQCV